MYIYQKITWKTYFNLTCISFVNCYEMVSFMQPVLTKNNFFTSDYCVIKSYHTRNLLVFFPLSYFVRRQLILGCDYMCPLTIAEYSVSFPYLIFFKDFYLFDIKN